MIKLGQDDYKKIFPEAVWPGAIPASVPLSVGFNGQADIAPQKGSAASQANNGNPYFTMQDLTAEAHLWAGGAINDSLTYFAQITLSADGVEIEQAYLMFNDIFAGALGTHAVNLSVGKNFATIGSFGAHSSYLVDPYIPAIAVPQLFAGDGTLTPGANQLNGVEITGVFAGGRLDYSLGINQGTNELAGTIRPSEDFYGHIGGKIGGMRLDGEGMGQVSTRPWEETALTVDAFAYKANSYYNNDLAAPWSSGSFSYGGAIRGQLASLELDLEAFNQNWKHADSTGTVSNTLNIYGELSYVIYPWLIPAFRIEYTQVTDTEAGSPLNGEKPSVVRYIPGINFLLRPNVKVVVLADIESGTSQPPGGWSGASGALIAPPPGMSSSEIETISFILDYAF